MVLKWRTNEGIPERRIDKARGKSYNKKQQFPRKDVLTMKTTMKTMDYDAVMALPTPEPVLPQSPSLPFRCLIRLLSAFGLAGTHFQYETEGLELVEPGEPCLILMNHSCFLDMEIASRILFPRPYCIVTT